MSKLDQPDSCSVRSRCSQRIYTEDVDEDNSHRQVQRHRLWVRDGICRRIDRSVLTTAARQRGEPMSPVLSLQPSLARAGAPVAAALTDWPYPTDHGVTMALTTELPRH